MGKLIFLYAVFVTVCCAALMLDLSVVKVDGVSMEPTHKNGSYILCMAASECPVGAVCLYRYVDDDLAEFYHNDTNGIIHRYLGDGVYKGDGNSWNDSMSEKVVLKRCFE